MSKIKRAAIAVVLLTIMFLTVLPACSPSPTSDAASPDDAGPPPEKDLRYDYDLLYTYRNREYEAASFAALAGLLQSNDTLTVGDTAYESGILRISFQLNLTAEEPDYRIDFTKQMQDAIVLFALLDYLTGVEFNYTQADYSFGGVPIRREDAAALLGEAITPLGSTEAVFKRDLPAKVQTVVWDTGVMDVVNYYHALGLDEKDGQ
ncbi:MAG: hypothetical protein ACOX8W_12425 [bacterium]|jgi:hypothetical protein